MSNTYRDFLPFIMPDFPGCPEALALQKLKSRINDFCERTGILTETIPLTSFPGSAEYDLAADDKYVPHVILHVKYDKKPLKIEHGRYVDVIDKVTTPGAPSRARFRDPAHFQLIPAPKTSRSDAIEVRATIKPGPATTKIKDRLYDNWREEIVYGVKHDLLNMPGKPWYNPTAALRELTLYFSGVSSARIQAEAGYSTSEMMVRQRPFA